MSATSALSTSLETSVSAVAKPLAVEFKEGGSRIEGVEDTGALTAQQIQTRILYILEHNGIDDQELFTYVDQLIADDESSPLRSISTPVLCTCAGRRLKDAVISGVPLKKVLQSARIFAFSILSNRSFVANDTVTIILSLLDEFPAVLARSPEIAVQHSEKTRVSIAPYLLSACHIDHLPKLLLHSPHSHDMIAVLLSAVALHLVCLVGPSAKVVNQQPDVMTRLLDYCLVVRESRCYAAYTVARCALSSLQSMLLAFPSRIKTEGLTLQVALALSTLMDLSIAELRLQGMEALHVIELLGALLGVVSAYVLIDECAEAALLPVYIAYGPTGLQQAFVDPTDLLSPTLLDQIVDYTQELMTAPRNATTERALYDALSALRCLGELPKCRPLMLSRGYLPLILRCIGTGAPAMTERALGHVMALVLSMVQNQDVKEDMLTSGIVAALIPHCATNRATHEPKRRSSVASVQAVVAASAVAVRRRSSIGNLAEPLRMLPMTLNPQVYALSTMVWLLEAVDAPDSAVPSFLRHNGPELFLRTLHRADDVETATLLLRCIAAIALTEPHAAMSIHLQSCGTIQEMLSTFERIVKSSASRARSAAPAAGTLRTALKLPKADDAFEIASEGSPGALCDAMHRCCSLPIVSPTAPEFEAISYVVQIMVSLSGAGSVNDAQNLMLSCGVVPVCYWLFGYTAFPNVDVACFGPSLLRLSASLLLNLLTDTPASIPIIIAQFSEMGNRQMEIEATIAEPVEVIAFRHRLRVAGSSLQEAARYISER